jgi:gamma-glutamylcyclotransferase (GGCT)/AIG2-like uncharacterized protein YtfP
VSAVTYNSPSPPNWIFAYGTLMKGQSRHRLLEPAEIKSILPASLSGELLDFGEYPGLRLTSRGNSRVRGELIELGALDKVMEQIDEEEGPEFRREIVNATADSGETHFAWVYVLASEKSDAPPIPSGDWREK